MDIGCLQKTWQLVNILFPLHIVYDIWEVSQFISLKKTAIKYFLVFLIDDVCALKNVNYQYECERKK